MVLMRMKAKLAIPDSSCRESKDVFIFSVSFSNLSIVSTPADDLADKPYRNSPNSLHGILL